MAELPRIVLPAKINYVAAFLTFACTLRCPYCINHHGGDLVKGRKMNGEDWIRGLNRFVARADLPITLQGGEPTVHKDFYKIVNGIRKEIPVDMLTNLEVDVETFERNISPDRLRRESPYASIRVSYHRGQSNRDELLGRVGRLHERGYHIGIWIVDHPEYREHTEETIILAQEKGIDIRKKEFLGPWKGVEHGTMRYPDAVNAHSLRHCDCRTSEVLIAPDGFIFRCHSDLYANRSAIGHILDPGLHEGSLGNWQYCGVYGKCNSCDIKVKFNRFQQWGHSSVEIRGITEVHSVNADHVSEVVNTYGKSDAKKGV